jgi:hypothetical protein
LGEFGEEARREAEFFGTAEEFGEGDGHEGTFPETGMRKGEIGRVANFIFIEEKIEIEGARAPADFAGAGATGRAFGGAEKVEEFFRAEGGFQPKHEVEKRRLVGVADGGGLEDG